MEPAKEQEEQRVTREENQENGDPAGKDGNKAILGVRVSEFSL